MEKLKTTLIILAIISLFGVLMSVYIGVFCSIWNLDFIVSEIKLCKTFSLLLGFFGVLLLILDTD